jgi:anti-sigma factor RsiW
MHPTEIESQMLRMLDGELSTDETAELDRKLITNPETRQKWQSMARIHSALETRYSVNKTIAQSTPVTISRILEE